MARPASGVPRDNLAHSSRSSHQRWYWCPPSSMAKVYLTRDLKHAPRSTPIEAQATEVI